MTDNRYDVLLDLSYSNLGNSGIPLDTRWLFKQLSSNDRINLTGLLYPFQKETIGVSSVKKNDKFKLLKYSQYLALMSTPIKNEEIESHLLPLRVLRKLKNLYKTYLKTNFKVWEKDTKLFNDVIYRNFFESGLDSKDIDIVLNGKFAFTDYYKYVQLGRIFSPLRLFKPYLNTKKYDIIINQDSIPLRLPSKTQQVIRYHDPIQLTTPDAFQTPYDAATLHFLSTYYCIKKGAIYICNSEPVKEELIELFPIAENNVVTIPYTISQIYQRVNDIHSLIDILEGKISPHVKKHEGIWKSYFSDIRKSPKRFKYITQVATIEPRKNHINVVKAFEKAKLKLKKETNIDLKLIIVGEIGWKYKKILEEIEPKVAKGDVLLTSSMHPTELNLLYSHAEAFIFPSFKEGFGLPPVEAMLCGVPVISSDIKVHKWVQGPSSFYVNPYNIEEMSETIYRVVSKRDSTEIKNRIKAGISKASTYSASENEKKWSEFFDSYRLGKFKGPSV